MNSETLGKLQAASKILEEAHIVGGKPQNAFNEAEKLVGNEIACALLVAIMRAESGSLELLPVPDHIDAVVRHELAREGILKV